MPLQLKAIIQNIVKYKINLDNYTLTKDIKLL